MLACALLLCVVGRAVAFTTPLDEYIALPDPNYSYFDTVRRCAAESTTQRHSSDTGIQLQRPWVRCIRAEYDQSAVAYAGRQLTKHMVRIHH